MPLQTNRQKPRKGTLRSYVLWHMQHGTPLSEIISRAHDRNKSWNPAKVKKEAEYWKKTFQAGARVNSLPATSRLRDSSIPTRVKDTGTVRVTVKLKFNNPTLHKQQQKAFVVDIQKQKNKADMIKEIRSKLIDWALQNYGAFNDEFGKAGKAILNVQISQIERM